MKIDLTKIKPIKNYTGYFISEDGKVYCAFKIGQRTDLDSSYSLENLREIKGRPGANQYLRVYMRNDVTRKRKDEYIHRLVATHFIPNPESKKVVHHIDGNRTNNILSNLQWVTYKENNEDTMQRNKVTRCSLTGKFQSTDN